MEKHKFSELYALHNISTPHLAAISGESITTIDRMLTDLRVFRESAEKVLSAFSQLTGETYTLDNVYVNLLTIAVIVPPKREGADNKSEVARLMQQIEDEYTAGKQGLEGLAQGMSQHKVITIKQENIAHYFNELTDLIGKEATEQFFMNLNVKPEEQENS